MHNSVALSGFLAQSTFHVARKCNLFFQSFIIIMSTDSNTTRSTDGRLRTNGGERKKEEEQVELPKSLGHLFEKELINKYNKHIYVMDTFGPSRNTQHLATKFYARHEQHLPSNAAAAFVPFVYGPSCKQQTEAHVYGWMPETIKSTNILKQLNFVSAPRQGSCLTAFGEKIEIDRANARPSFNGLRFFLQ